MTIDSRNQVGRLSRQSGSVIIFVLITTFVVLLIASALINHFMVAEARAVADSLARVRVYWAMAGQADFVQSRTRQYSSILEADPAPPGLPTLTEPSKDNFRTALAIFDFSTVPGNCGNAKSNTPAALATEFPGVIRCFFEELEGLDTETVDNALLWDYSSVVTDIGEGTGLEGFVMDSDGYRLLVGNRLGIPGFDDTNATTTIGFELLAEAAEPAGFPPFLRGLPARTPLLSVRSEMDINELIKTREFFFSYEN